MGIAEQPDCENIDEEIGYGYSMTLWKNYYIMGNDFGDKILLILSFWWLLSSKNFNNCLGEGNEWVNIVP